MDTADILLAGPRGRRLLLAFALEGDRLHEAADPDDTLFSAVMLASYHLDPGRGRSVVLFGPGAEDAEGTVVTAEEVASRLAQTPLPEVTPVGLRWALADAVDSARYWQEPEGKDVLAATEPVRRELRRVAEHIARSPHTDWWTTGPAATAQCTVWSWGVDGPGHPVPAASTLAEQLRSWRKRTVAEEERAARERPADPTANFSAVWWSTPPTRSSTRQLPGGTPAELWFVEDRTIGEQAVTRRVHVPAEARVYELDSARAWAALCAQFPLEVTAQKRHDWYRTTGRAGRWVVPDWTRVAAEYAGVHLTVTGYLTAAGTAIDTTAGAASVIAGWAPDATYWLTDTAGFDGDTRTWVCDTTGERPRWTDAGDRSAQRSAPEA
ncbi:hypothetical protein AB0H71_30300 [Nocardia sp. NPDC050697]|uniref:hypothetical protein n=1 Tax=Nocardia sp. NPDC050697 TaxID=3155158 RepID=UPI0033EC87D4